jgi:prolipoprotein diacylglyceryl transferase
MAQMIFPQYRKGKVGIDIFEGTILEHARKLGIEISSECGGEGICGKCIVRVESGIEGLAEKTEAEKSFKLREDERLACQARVIKPIDIHLFVKEMGKYTILVDTVEDKITLNPFVYKRNDKVLWKGPTGEDELGEYTGNMYGLAIDVGTTTLVSQIIDLEKGEKIATFSRRNPQSSYGDDVISRAGYTMNHKKGLKELQQVVVNAINESLKEFEENTGDNSDKIYEAVVVGNSTMRSIFFGIDVSTLCVMPFEPHSKEPVNIKAKELGLHIHPNANVYGPGLIGGHAGADALADILASEMYKKEKPQMTVDIGTNGEVIVGNKNGLMTASCAAGGAYEGATVKSGVGAIEGAIKNIRIIAPPRTQVRGYSVGKGKAEYETIGDKPAIGICGSGLIDLLAELLKNGIINERGKFTNPEKQFVVDEERGISITQEDVNQLILARSGLSLDQKSLIKHFSTSVDKIENIYLAGARIFHIVENFKQFLASPFSFVFTGAGFAWYGGLGGGALAAGGVVLKKKQPLSVVADCVAPGLALGYGIGRIGCFLSGDGCYGKPTSGWFKMAFPYGIVPTKYAVDELTGKRIPIEWVHPTPLYELTVSLLIFALLWKLRKKELKSGTIFWLYLALAGCARFLVEFWRRNPIVAIGLTMAQILSILAIGLGIFFVFLNLWNILKGIKALFSFQKEKKSILFSFSFDHTFLFLSQRKRKVCP